MSRSHRPIETVSALLGRPAFFYGIVLFVTLWVLLNLFAPLWAVAPFDPPPYFWLQGLVGLGALLTTTMVLITQTRQGKLAEQRAQLDLQVSLLAEQKTAKLIALLEELRRDLPEVTNRHDAEAAAMEQSTDPHAILDALETLHEPVPAEAGHAPREHPDAGDGHSQPIGEPYRPHGTIFALLGSTDALARPGPLRRSRGAVPHPLRGASVGSPPMAR